MSDVVSYGMLKRISWLPNRDAAENGTVIAGQEYDDIEFIGGAISNVILTDVTINGETTSRQITVIVDPGDYVVQSDDYIIYVNKTVPQITTITLPTGTESRSLVIKDASGNAASFNVTIDGNGTLIDGQATRVMTVDYQSLEFNFSTVTGEWEIIASTGDLGDVSGPGSSTDNAIARFNGTTGQSIQNSVATVSDTGIISALSYTSTVATGTAPLVVASTTTVSNLTSDNTRNIDAIDDVLTATSVSPVWVSASGAFTIPHTSASLSFVPSTGILSATGFNGPITGTASAVNVIDAASDTTTWVMLAGNQTGGQTPLSDSGLTFNASTNNLTTTTFTGALAGNATTATAASTATLANDAADATSFLVFSGTSTGNQALKTNTGLLYDATTNNVTATTFTGSFSGTATNATNIITATEAADTTCFPVFVTASGSQTLPPKTNTGLTFNASTAQLGSTSVAITGALGAVFTGQAAPAYAQGKLVYDTDNECLTFCNNDSNISLQIGQENWYRVLNNSGGSIANGAAVKITGASGGLPTIALIQANASDVCAGLVTETLANAATGYVTISGLVRGIDTSGFSAGATLYVSSATPGALTATPPTAPNYRIRIGTVGVSNASTGTILVNGLTTGLGLGTASQLLGVNAGATAQEWKSPSTAFTVGVGTLALTSRTIGGVAFDGTANIVPQTIQSINEATDTTCFPLFISASGTQSLQPLNNTSFTFNSNTGAVGATSFVGALTGNASTATALQTARAIGIGGTTGLTATGVNFDGTAAINPTLTGTLVAANGGTGQSTYAVGDILYASASTTLSKLADVAAGSYLRSGGVTTAPVWSTTTLPNSATTGDIMYASGANTYANLADVAVGSVLVSGGAGAVPSYSSTPTVGNITVNSATVPANGMYLPNTNSAGWSTNSTFAGAFDSSQRFLVGNGANVSIAAGGGSIQTTKIDSGSGLASNYIGQFTANGSGAAILMSKSRNGSIGSHTIVQSGDLFGQMLFYGSNGTTFDLGAYMLATVDGTPGVSADMPGRLGFFTAPDGSATPAEAFRIDNAGACYFPRLGTTATAANAILNSGSTPVNSLLRNSSSILYKTDVEDLLPGESSKIYDLRPIWYRSNSEYDNPDWGWDGLLAEEVAKINPRWATWGYREIDQREIDDNGIKRTEPIYTDHLVPDGVQYPVLTVSIIAEMKKLKDEINQLRIQINEKD